MKQTSTLRQRLTSGGRMTVRVAAAAPLLAVVACGEQASVADKIAPAPAAAERAPSGEDGPSDLAALFDPAQADRLDKFSYSNFGDVVVTHVALDLDLDFATRALLGTATFEIERLDPAADRLILDSDDLTIAAVEVERADGEWTATPFILGQDDPLLGAALEIDLPADAKRVRVAYVTSPGAAGLQWLAPEQTRGGEAPYVYSQAQAIHARSIVPLQDTPAVRITYEASIAVKGVPVEDILVLMSAAQPEDQARDGEFEFDMPQPIPPYLIAIAAGDIVFERIDDEIGVYAEPYIAAAAAAEFAETPRMEEIAEGLYGPYRWGRYDMLVLPPSFPFGGMENPRLTFLTPTLVAGDRSLTNVVAHELAHSWSGNLVTNATWRDSWLNEGFTSYVENRIMEALYGAERARMERSLDLASLRAELTEMADPTHSQLKLPASIASTDAGFTGVAYSKGMFFLKRLEEAFGRDEFDAFLKSYFDAFAFRPVVTEDFLGYLRTELMEGRPGAISAEEIAAWVLEPGLPETIETPTSNRFAAVALQQADWLTGVRSADAIEAGEWTTHEWLHFIKSLPVDLTLERFAELDAVYALSAAKNAEIAFAWYMKAIPADYGPAFDGLGEFLVRVGRGKFIYPLYTALAESGSRRSWAEEVYARARAGYHPIAQRRIDAVFGRLPE